MERVHKRAACIRLRDQALLCFKIALRHLTSAVVAVFRNDLQRPSSPQEMGVRESVFASRLFLRRPSLSNQMEYEH